MKSGQVCAGKRESQQCFDQLFELEDDLRLFQLPDGLAQVFSTIALSLDEWREGGRKEAALHSLNGTFHPGSLTIHSLPCLPLVQVQFGPPKSTLSPAGPRQHSTGGRELVPKQLGFCAWLQTATFGMSVVERALTDKQNTV